MANMFYVLGTTCAGKSYFIDKALERYPEKFAAVEVGKEFRRRHPPEYFQGSAAPDHTEQEAITIFNELHEQALQTGRPNILVSGQPRRLSQLAPTALRYPGTMLWLYAEPAVLRERAMARDQTEEELKLSLARIDNDRIQIFDLLFEMLKHGLSILPVQSGGRSEVHELIEQIAEGRVRTSEFLYKR